MGHITEKRKLGAVCPRCKFPEYKLLPSDPDFVDGGKPMFQCTSCGDIWCHGYDGGVYMQFAIKRGQDIQDEILPTRKVQALP